MSELAFTDDAGRFYRVAFEEAITQRDEKQAQIERLRDRCIELLGALRGVLDNPMGGYEQADAYLQARSRAAAVAAQYDGGHAAAALQLNDGDADGR